jgi:site-specific DNA-methyltransferase (adenine-specific)
LENKVIIGDCREVLKTLPEKSIHCCVTSPPYFKMRRYCKLGTPEADKEIGQKKTPEEYVNELVEVFREVNRVLRDDGTLWLNIGEGKRTTFQLPGIPWKVAFALQDNGWILKQEIVWNKGNAMCESVRSRPTKSHEYVFLFSKSKKYYYDYKSIREPCSEQNIQDFLRRKTLDNKGTHGNTRIDLSRSRKDYMPPDFLRNKRSVWNINTKPYKGAHFATFPPALIEPCILAGCPENGLVLDPFGGSGTVGEVCNKLGRNYILIELNPEYKTQIDTRVAISI